MDELKKEVQAQMTRLAGVLNRQSNGKIRPVHITVLSLFGHIPAAWALVNSRPVLAGILLGFFALLDALDGALARVQNSASLSGMYFDAVSDRLKEVIIFSALGVFIYKQIDPAVAWQAAAAVGTSLLVSYVKAKGEMAVIGQSKLNAQKLNRAFEGGIASYEIRVILLVVALLFGLVEIILPLIIILNSITIVVRFLKIKNFLQEIDSKEKTRKDGNRK